MSLKELDTSNLNFICKVTERYKDNIYFVEINDLDMKEFPCQSHSLRRIINFTDNIVIINNYYIIWNGTLNTETRIVTVKSITPVNPHIKTEEDKEAEKIDDFFDVVVKVDTDSKKKSVDKLSEKEIEEILSPIIFPVHLTYGRL